MGAGAPPNRGRWPAPVVIKPAGRGRSTAIVQALLVTFLWSTSWVLIKIGLSDLTLPPITFAALRYALAAVVLLPLAVPALRVVPRTELRSRTLFRVALLGVLLYAVTQGAQYAALVHLPAVAVSLALSATPLVVGLLAARGNERPTLVQLAGTLALFAGAAIYFGPLSLGPDGSLGLAIIAVGVAANAVSALLGRALVRDDLPKVGGTLGLTALSLAIGAIVLLVAGVVVEGMPALDGDDWLIIGWLAVVNTAFAFTLWNHTLRTVTAVESSVLNNLMLIQIAVLAWLFLGETLDARQIAGLALAFAGIVAVQIRRQSPPVTADGPAAGG
jgi:drug/metabolite transporter (DMT)-like permease